MLASRLLDVMRTRSLRRSPDVPDRVAALVFVARFVDELLSGALTVLVPTFRRAFGLSVLAAAALEQVLAWVALVVEPPAALLSDLGSRRALLALGATAVGVATLVAGLAPGPPALVVAFAVYGIGSGPLTHTADVVLVEVFADDADRAYARVTVLDTVGALLAPAIVAATVAAGVSWRLLLGGLALGTLAYAGALARTPFSAPRAATRGERGQGGRGVARQLVGNVREVTGDARARSWLACLLCLDVLEAPNVLRYLWLAEVVGFGQVGLGAYVVGEQVVGLVALLWLDRHLQRPQGGATLLVGACAGILVLHPVWLLAPGAAGRIVVGVPLAFLTALLWPVARSRALASVPGRAGAVTAVATVFGAVPLTLAAGATAEVIGLVPAMLAFTLVGGVGLLAAARRAGALAPPGAGEDASR